MKGERLILEARRSAPSLGLLIVLAAMAAVAFALIAKNLTFERPWQSYREVKVDFDDVKGIFPKGHQVRIHGVKVGIVKESKLVDGHPQLTLAIEKKWGPVYKDARMQIRPVTPLQDLYVNVTNRGTPAAGELKGDDVLASQRTISPVDISRVLDTFNADTRQRMAILLTEMGKGLDDDGGQKLRATFAELAPFLHVAEDTTRALAERQAALKRVVTNFGELSSTLAKRDTEINEFVTQGNITLGELARNDQPLAQTLSGLSDLLPVMRSSFSSVDQLTGHLDPALDSLNPIAKTLKGGLQGLEQVGEEGQPAFRRLRPAVTQLRQMARVLPATAKAMSRAFGTLNQQAPQFNRITDEIVPCMNGQVQDFFQNTVSVLKYGDANGTFPRADEIVDTDALAVGGGGQAAVNFQKIKYCTEEGK